jgi:hypothetical protein
LRYESKLNGKRGSKATLTETVINDEYSEKIRTDTTIKSNDDGTLIVILSRPAEVMANLSQSM